MDGLCLVIGSESTREAVATLTFVDFVAYRNINESFRNRTWRQLNGEASGLVIVKGSSWLKWLSEESDGLLSADELVHYAIYTVDDCVDVAARVEPHIEALGAPRQP